VCCANAVGLPAGGGEGEVGGEPQPAATSSRSSAAGEHVTGDGTTAAV
jgi:hypothetical protein